MTGGAFPPEAAVLVSGAGWEKANGIYLPLPGAPSTFENAHSFLLSQELFQEQPGWILGIGGKPLYAVGTRKLEPPLDGWRCLKSWGKAPAPTVRLAESVTAALIADVDARLPRAEEAMEKRDWQGAKAVWEECLDQLAHLLEEDEEVARLTNQLKGKVAALPRRRAGWAREEAALCKEKEDWEGADAALREAMSLLDDEELRAEAAALPKAKANAAWRHARAAYDAESFEEAQAWLQRISDDNEAAEMTKSCVSRRAEALQKQGERLAAEGSVEAFFSADALFMEALELVEDCDGINAARSRAAATLAESLLPQLEGALSNEDYEQVDGGLEALSAALEPCVGADDAKEKLKAFEGKVVEKKVAEVLSQAEAAASSKDFEEADVCWMEALQVLESSARLSKAAEAMKADVVMKRQWWASTKAGELMRRGDLAVINEDLFAADERYCEAIDWMESRHVGPSPTHVKLRFKRAEVRHRKWQHRQAIEDCHFVIEKSRDREEKCTALLLAAQASRALHLKLVEDLGYEDAKRFHEMDKAVAFLEDAAKLSEDNPELQRELRMWRRQVPPRPQPVPMPPFDWSKVPKQDKANYFGKVDRRVGFSDQEIEELWSLLRKEQRSISGPEDPEFCGYDETTALPKQRPPRHVGRSEFLRALRHVSAGGMEEEDLEALWQEADSDGDGLASFEDFAAILRNDG